MRTDPNELILDTNAFACVYVVYSEWVDQVRIQGNCRDEIKSG